MIKFQRDFELHIDDNISCLMDEAFQRVVEECENGVAGYYNLPEDSKMVVTEVEALSSSETIKNSDTIAVIGIGGSSLGAKAIDSMLRHKYPQAKRLIFFENPDPVETLLKFASMDKEKTIFIVISKSGSTIETMSLFKAVISYFKIDLNGDDKDRLIAITDEGSVLCRFADRYGIKVYTIPHNVGGRFSVLSAVGIVPLTLAGYDCCSILEGGAKIVRRFFNREEDHILLKAAFIATNWEKYRMNVLFAYASFLDDFTKWYVQLWGESLGKIDKSGNRVGLTPLGQIGSIDQHSFLQLIIEGPIDKTVTFIKIEDFENDILIPDITFEGIQKCDFVNGHTFNELINAECDATREAIAQQGVPVDAIIFDKLSEANIGELILYYEILTSLTGSILNINTYNQPGVELGKRILADKFKK
jgi:glucose-6-phosphate isomerase